MVVEQPAETVHVARVESPSRTVIPGYGTVENEEVVALGGLQDGPDEVKQAAAEYAWRELSNAESE